MLTLYAQEMNYEAYRISDRKQIYTSDRTGSDMVRMRCVDMQDIILGQWDKGERCRLAAKDKGSGCGHADVDVQRCRDPDGYWRHG